MDQEKRAHIRLLLEHEVVLATRAVEQRVLSIYTEHAAEGRLRSGATVRVAVRAMEEMASQLVATSVLQVSGVAQDVDAFAEIATAVDGFLDQLAAKVRSVANMASGRQSDDLTEDSVSTAAVALFKEARAHVVKQGRLRTS